MTRTGKEEVTMNKLMIKLVVGTEAMFFLSLIVAFVYFSLAPGFKHLQLSVLDIKSTGIFSLFLFSSSFTYWRAESNYRRGNMNRLKIWLLFTLLLGLIFLGGQGKEYLKLFHEHVNISSDTFGTSFFTLTGFHGLHVLVGLIIISIVTGLAFLGDFDIDESSVIRTVGIYWHFVDIVWVFVFLVIYVVPYLNRL
jgi:heme/copper-type cytochrome/quinol oxidase subunit 3